MMVVGETEDHHVCVLAVVSDHNMQRQFYCGMFVHHSNTIYLAIL